MVMKDLGGPDPWGTSPGACCPGPVGCSPTSLCTAGLGSGQISPYSQSLLGKYFKMHVTLMQCKKNLSYSYRNYFIIIPSCSSQELIGKVTSLFVHQLKAN